MLLRDIFLLFFLALISYEFMNFIRYKLVRARGFLGVNFGNYRTLVKSNLCASLGVKFPRCISQILSKFVHFFLRKKVTFSHFRIYCSKVWMMSIFLLLIHVQKKIVEIPNETNFFKYHIVYD